LAEGVVSEERRGKRSEVRFEAENHLQRLQIIVRLVKTSSASVANGGGTRMWNGVTFLQGLAGVMQELQLAPTLNVERNGRLSWVHPILSLPSSLLRA
jgi:hypothetical protein